VACGVQSVALLVRSAHFHEAAVISPAAIAYAAKWHALHTVPRATCTIEQDLLDGGLPARDIHYVTEDGDVVRWCANTGEVRSCIVD
jgi:hypothetical protein